MEAPTPRRLRFGSSTQAPISDGEGTTRRGRRLHEPEAVGYGGRRALPEPPAHEAREEEPHQRAERNKSTPAPRITQRQQGLKLEREAILQPAVPEAAGYFLGAQHTDHHRPVAGQAFDHDLPALRHGHLQRLLEEGMRSEGAVTVLRAGVIDDGIVPLRRLVVAGAAGRPGRPPLLCSFERLSCSRFRFEQLAPYVEERPTDEHGSPEQDESGNDGHRDRYAGKLRDEAHGFTTNITQGHGGLLKRWPAYLKAARQGRPPRTRRGSTTCVAGWPTWWYLAEATKPQRRRDEADTPGRCRCSFGSARARASGGRGGYTRREVRGC